MRRADLRDEERAAREDEVRAEHAEHRRGEAEGPVGHARVHEGEEQTGGSGQECAADCENASAMSCER